MSTHSSYSCLENPMDRGAWRAAVQGGGCVCVAGRGGAWGAPGCRTESNRIYGLNKATTICHSREEGLATH